MNRNLLITILGLALWFSVTPKLFLLPPTEVALYVKIFKQDISEHSESLPSCTVAEPEWKAEMVNYISNAKHQEKLLWVKWIALFSLVLLAVIGWLLFKLNKPIAKWLILITSALLVLKNVVFHSSGYLVFSKMLVGGSINLLPWHMIISSFYDLLALPFMPTILTVMVFKVKPNPSFKRDA